MIYILVESKCDSDFIIFAAYNNYIIIKKDIWNIFIKFKIQINNKNQRKSNIYFPLISFCWKNIFWLEFWNYDLYG